MRSNLDASTLMLREAEVENPATIFMVEIYHAPLHAAFYNSREEQNRKTTDYECIKIALFGINFTI